jgi:hypothetical protein
MKWNPASLLMLRLCEILRLPDITQNRRGSDSLCATLLAMSSDEAAGDAHGQQRVTHIILRTEGWFEGPDRVLPVAAYELDGRAAVDSVVYGHAGCPVTNMSARSGSVTWAGLF